MVDVAANICPPPGSPSAAAPISEAPSSAPWWPPAYDLKTTLPI